LYELVQFLALDVRRERMTTAEEHRAKAADCRRQAERAQDPRVRRDFLAIAKDYDRLAEIAEEDRRRFG
jgi:hypothetical protein